MDVDIENNPSCPLCGAFGAGGLEGCLDTFATLGACEFSDPRYFAVHRLTVDAYCLQHPERFMISTKSAATHLTAMCWTMEQGLSRHLPVALKAYVDGLRTFVRVSPPLPGNRGDVTIADIARETAIEAYQERAWEWANSAWNAWSEHWDQARRWVQAARNSKFAR